MREAQQPPCLHSWRCHQVVCGGRGKWDRVSDEYSWSQASSLEFSSHLFIEKRNRVWFTGESRLFLGFSQASFHMCIYFHGHASCCFLPLLLFYSAHYFPTAQVSHCQFVVFHLSRENSWPVKRRFSTQCDLEQGELKQMRPTCLIFVRN